MDLYRGRNGEESQVGKGAKVNWYRGLWGLQRQEDEEGLQGGADRVVGVKTIIHRAKEGRRKSFPD